MSGDSEVDKKEEVKSKEKDVTTEKSPDVDEKKPLVIVLHRSQTPVMLKGVLMHATTTMAEKGHIVSECKIAIEGYNDGRYPWQIPGVKRKYAEAIDTGLIGFLVAHGFKQVAGEVYCIAYLKGKTKKGQAKFNQVNAEVMQAKFDVSQDAYMELLESQLEE